GRGFSVPRYHRVYVSQTSGVVTIDSVMHGTEGVTAVYYLPGPRPAIIEAAPATSLARVLAGLSAAGVTDLDWIVLTHIHLDHARHHMARFEPGSGDLFTGDAAGVFLDEVGAVHPATPPPEFDLEASLESLRRLKALGARRALPTHFGLSALEPDRLFDEAAA